MEFLHMITNNPIMIQYFNKLKCTIDFQMTNQQLTDYQIIFCTCAHLTAIPNQYAPEERKSIKNEEEKKLKGENLSSTIRQLVEAQESRQG